jgi:hypothetical protein
MNCDNVGGQDFDFVVYLHTVLSGCLVTTAWRVLRLQIEETDMEVSC